MLRIPLGMAFVAFAREQAVALTILGLAALSDALDGAVARQRREVSDTGALADAVADKIFAACVIMALFNRLDEPALLALLAREIGLLPLVVLIVFRGGPRAAVKALPVGKAATALQFASVIAVVARLGIATPLLAATALFGVLAAAEYWTRELGVRR